MLKKKEDYWKKAEKVKLTQNVRVKEHGSDEVKMRKKGEVVTVSGAEKFELITRGLAKPVKAEDKK